MTVIGYGINAGVEKIVSEGLVSGSYGYADGINLGLIYFERGNYNKI